jgi:hypothetical protein
MSFASSTIVPVRQATLVTEPSFIHEPHRHAPKIVEAVSHPPPSSTGTSLWTAASGPPSARPTPLQGPQRCPSAHWTTLLPSCFPAPIVSPCTNLLVSFRSSPPPQIASPLCLDHPRTVSPPPRHWPSPESAGRHHQRAMAAPPLLRPWALRPGLAGPCCLAGLEAEVGWPKGTLAFSFFPPI